MTENERITIKSLVELGFDVKTGVSDEISMKVLEQHSGVRQVSNGSKIIRRDSRVFGLFNISWNYCTDTGSLLTVRFCGYKTSKDVEQSLQEEVSRLHNKIKNLEEQKRLAIKASHWVSENGLEDLSIYDLLEKL